MSQYTWLTRNIYRVPGSVLGAGDVTMNETDKTSVLSGVTVHGSQRLHWEYITKIVSEYPRWSLGLREQRRRLH